MQSIEQTFAFELIVNVGKSTELGQTAKGVRRAIPILGGTFAGPNIQGAILPGGYDWQLIRADGVAEVEARYLLQTDNGALINLVNQGLRHGPPEVMQQLARGEAVDPSLYYFRSTFMFETADERYQWLTHSVFVGTGSRQGAEVRIGVFRVV